MTICNICRVEVKGFERFLCDRHEPMANPRVMRRWYDTCRLVRRRRAKGHIDSQNREYHLLLLTPIWREAVASVRSR